MFNLGKAGGALMEARKQQDKMKSVQVIGESKDHLVKVHINGAQEVSNITIDEVLLQPEKAKEVKKDLIDAFKDAQQKLQKELMKTLDMEQMKKLLGM